MRKAIVLCMAALAAGSAAAQPPPGVATGTEAAAPLPAEANVRAALERIARIDPLIHSVIAIDPSAIDQARAVDAGNLRGPLAGQPVLIKDNIESAGPLPTTAGSLALAANVLSDGAVAYADAQQQVPIDQGI